jgi:hypothetical protein
MRTPHGLQSLMQRVPVEAGGAQELLAALALEQRQQEMLGRDELVAELLHFAQRLAESAVELRVEGELGPLHGRPLAQAALDLLGQGARLDAELLEQGGDDALVLLHEGEQQVQGLETRVLPRAGQLLGGLDGLLGLDGELLELHLSSGGAGRSKGSARLGDLILSAVSCVLWLRSLPSSGLGGCCQNGSFGLPAQRRRLRTRVRARMSLSLARSSLGTRPRPWPRAKSSAARRLPILARSAQRLIR